MCLAEAADKSSLPEEMAIPEELKRRAERRSAIARAKQDIEKRAQERFEREQAAFEDKRAKREARAKQTGKKPRGNPPQPPTSGPQAKDQVNLTDADSRIMLTSSGGFEQAYNAQAGADVETHIIVTQHVTQHANYKQEFAPAVAAIDQLPQALGEAGKPAGRHRLLQRGQYPDVRDSTPRSFHPAGAGETQPPINGVLQGRSRTATGSRAATNLATSAADQGRQGALRQAQIDRGNGLWHHQQVLEFRQFLLRWLESVQSEWTLVCIGWNLKRMHALRG